MSAENTDNSQEKPKLPRMLSAAELRVLGVLIEKSLTTPEQYPLSLNSTKVGSNQKTSREPVVNYDDRTVGIALKDLIELKLARENWPADRGTVKYEHCIGRALDLRQPQFAVLAVLMLRGAQTPGELRQNVHRLQVFDDVPHLEETLDRLAAREMVLKISRGPGQREDRYVHLLGEVDAAKRQAAAQTDAERAPRMVSANTNDDVITELRAEIAELSARVAALEARHADSA